MLRIIALAMGVGSVKIWSCTTRCHSGSTGFIDSVSHYLTIQGSDLLDNEMREIRLEGPLEPEDICSRAGHVTAEFSVVPTVLTEETESVYTADVEIGLTQHYGDKPGYVIMQMYATFPSQGDTKQDSAYLFTHIRDPHITMKYKKYLDVKE